MALTSTMNIVNLNSDGDGNTLLHFAARDGNIRLITTYITLGVDVNVTNNLGWTSLMIAVKNSHFKTAKTLVYLGADVSQRNGYGYCSLSIAASVGDLDIVRFLLKKRLKKGEVIHDIEQPVSPLAVAVLHSHFDAIQYFVEKSFRVNISSIYEGMTPMYIATVTRNNKVLDILKKYGCTSSENVSLQNIPIITFSDENGIQNRNDQYYNNLSYSPIIADNYSPFSILNTRTPFNSPANNMTPTTRFSYSNSPVFFPVTPKNVVNNVSFIRMQLNDFKQQIRKCRNRCRSTCTPLKQEVKEDNSDDVFENGVQKNDLSENLSNKNHQFIDLLRKNSLGSCMSLFQKHEIDLDVFMTLTRDDLHEIGIDKNKREEILKLGYKLRQQEISYCSYDNIF